MNSVILAIETATSACSVALGRGSDVFTRGEVGTNIHSQVLLNMISEVCAEANLKVSEINAVAVGQGPGSFTGLRIGIGVAQGIAYGANCPMIGVSSLAALALQAANSDPKAQLVLAGIDARMQEIYHAEYAIEAGLPQLIGEVKVAAPQQITSTKTGLSLAGNAWREYQAELAPELRSLKLPEPALELPDASAIYRLGAYKMAEGNVIDPRAFQPEYIRNNVAKKKGEA